MIYFEFFPYPFVLGLLLLVWALWRRRQRGWLHLGALMLFVLYGMAALHLMFFPLRIPEEWPANLSWQGTGESLARVNLIPFNYGSMFSDLAAGQIGAHVVQREIAGNIAFTIPFGMSIAFFKGVHGRQLFAWALGAGLVLEGAQMLIRLVVGFSLHSVDINDVLLNALGVMVGAAVFHVLAWGTARLRARFSAG